MSHSLDELLAAYAATAARWHDLRTDARAANAVFDENERLATALRASAEGREAIASLMSHDAGGVRVLAASDSLDFRAAEATVVLEELACGSGLHAIAAAYALGEFRAGRLEPDG